MNHLLLPIAVSAQTRWAAVRDRCREEWVRRADEAGVDEAVTKMIWLAVGIVVALAATAFFMSTFDKAKSSVPDPVSP